MCYDGKINLCSFLCYTGLLYLSNESLCTRLAATTLGVSRLLTSQPYQKILLPCEVLAKVGIFHVKYLVGAIKKAKHKLVIISPFLSMNALLADNIIELIQSRKGEVKITIYTNKFLDAPNGKIKQHAKHARVALEKSHASLKIVSGIHNKTILKDDDALIEGSFNWLAATRNEKSSYHRNETSICLLTRRLLKRIEFQFFNIKINNLKFLYSCLITVGLITGKLAKKAIAEAEKQVLGLQRNQFRSS